MGAHVTSTMHNDLSVAHCAAQTYAGAISLIALKEKFNLNMNLKDSKDATPLHFAVLQRECKNVELLIKYGINLDH